MADSRGSTLGSIFGLILLGIFMVVWARTCGPCADCSMADFSGCMSACSSCASSPKESEKPKPDPLELNRLFTSMNQQIEAKQWVQAEETWKRLSSLDSSYPGLQDKYSGIHEQAQEAKRVAAIEEAFQEVQTIDPKSGGCGEDPQRIVGLWQKLSVAKRTDSKYKEAVRSAAILEICRKSISRVLTSGFGKMMMEVRKDVAQKLEHSMLMNGIEATVRLSGTNKDVATITWALVGRSTVLQLTNDSSMASGSLLRSLQDVGVKKVVFYDGYEMSITYKLTPESETDAKAAIVAKAGLSLPFKIE
ncbi:MAG: hypothetical protein FJ125_10310 [Deltaproteobacteria bacterium]|nr:hypothetical protein [Deltaproteobacteria bacterium]